jgi:hopene-associated glycosyltransferase HpnB
LEGHRVSANFMIFPYTDAKTVVAALALCVWVYLTATHGWYWWLRGYVDEEALRKAPERWPRVVAIVPARNETETIGRTVASLTKQKYKDELSVIVVDDHSDDGTANVAASAARENGAAERVKIHAAAELPVGWTGKLWALQEGISVAGRENAEFYWFTDADVIHAPDTLERLVSRAEVERLDLTSLMVLLHAKTFPERALIPPFLYFFLMLYSPRWIADSKARTAGAAGGCVLLRRAALEKIGGIAAIRGEVIDDCALARAVKRSGGKIWMGLTRESLSLRAYESFGEIRDMIARTAFTQLHYSVFLLLGTLAGMTLTYIAPVALLFAHAASARWIAAAAWLLMSLTFLPTVRYFRLSAAWAPLLPFSALFYLYATWLSAARYWSGRGGQWKGRAQAARVTER